MPRNDDIKFIDGLIFKPPHENAPSYVIAKISIKRADLIAWLQAQDGEWINADLKESQGGKLYAAVDEWKPDQGRSRAPMREGSGVRQPQRPATRQPAPASDDDIPL